MAICLTFNALTHIHTYIKRHNNDDGKTNGINAIRMRILPYIHINDNLKPFSYTFFLSFFLCFNVSALSLTSNTHTHTHRKIDELRDSCFECLSAFISYPTPNQNKNSQSILNVYTICKTLMSSFG